MKSLDGFGRVFVTIVLMFSAVWMLVDVILLF